MPMDTLPQGTFDVAITGAGPAGGSLALRLARRGARVALLDASAFPRDKLCGEYLSPESWRVLDRMELADDLARSAYHPIHLVRITTPRGRVVEAEVAGPDGLPGIGLSRSVLDDLIVRHARAPGPRSSSAPGSADRSSPKAGSPAFRPGIRHSAPSRSGPTSQSPPAVGSPRWSARPAAPRSATDSAPDTLASNGT